MDNSPGDSDEDVVRADPSKAFFIEMLTRDISLADSILDLIDNAVDRAVGISSLDVMTVLSAGKANVTVKDALIALQFSKDEFRIRDTCGGISISDAKKEVFLFGNPRERGAEVGLSVYGIGMKRAFFKLGESIDIKSETKSEFFDIVIDVPTWRKEKKWQFEFTAKGKLKSHSQKPGTHITITKLLPEITQRLGQPAFQKELIRRVGTTYGLFLQAGVKVTINNTPVQAALPRISVKPFTPVRKTINYKKVQVLIIAGITPREDRGAHGWYVFCNGRMVLEADKTNLTGWGEGFPQFHSKYNHFIGYVYFKSDDVRALPWRTTKQGVEKEAPAYQAALNEMRLQAKPIVDFLRDMYPTDIEPEGVEERALLESAEAVSIEKMPRTESLFRVTKSVSAPNGLAQIKYKRPKKILDRIRRALDDQRMSASKIGEYTFDYFVEQELE